MASAKAWRCPNHNTRVESGASVPKKRTTTSSPVPVGTLLRRRKSSDEVTPRELLDNPIYAKSQREPPSENRKRMQSDPLVVCADVPREDTDMERESDGDISGEGCASEVGVGWSESKDGVGQDQSVW